MGNVAKDEIGEIFKSRGIYKPRWINRKLNTSTVGNKITTLNFYNIQNEMTIYCDYNWHSLRCRCNNCKNYICLRSGKRITKS